MTTCVMTRLSESLVLPPGAMLKTGRSSACRESLKMVLNAHTTTQTMRNRQCLLKARQGCSILPCKDTACLWVPRHAMTIDNTQGVQSEL